MYSQIQRNSLMNNERRIIIDEVNPSASVITGKDSYGKIFQVAFDFKDTLLAIPQQGQMWIVSQYNNEWRLERKLDTGAETTSSTEMNPGDYRVEADATLYLNGDSVLVNKRDVLAELDAQFQENVDQDASITAIETELSAISVPDVTSIEHDITDLQGDVSTINGEISTINTEITGINTTLTTIPDVTAINTHLTSLDAQMASANTQITIINTSIANVPRGAGPANTVPVWNGASYVNTTITDAQIAAGAAIAYTKLVLSGQIVDADVAAAAGISYSKLNLNNKIVNDDIAYNAALDINKLAGYPNDPTQFPSGNGTWKQIVTLQTVYTFGAVSGTTCTVTVPNSGNYLVFFDAGLEIATGASGGPSSASCTLTSTSGSVNGSGINLSLSTGDSNFEFTSGGAIALITGVTAGAVFTLTYSGYNYGTPGMNGFAMQVA